MIAQLPSLTSPSPVADSLAGLLVALDLKGVRLLLDANGQPRVKLPEGMTLDAETRALLGQHRAAIVEVLEMEAELWRLGRLAQSGDPEFLAAFKTQLAWYERRMSA